MTEFEKYPVPVWMTAKRWKETFKESPWVVLAIIRDKYRCVDCKKGNIKLIVHHIDESRNHEEINNELKNLATLCKSCHANRHGYKKDTKTIQELLELYSDGKKHLYHGAGVDIGLKMGISRERVRQIANKLGYITANNPKNTANKIHKLCRWCKKDTNGISNYCSVRHRQLVYFYTYQSLVVCKECNKGYLMRRSQYKAKGSSFCSKYCQGKWLAKTYGAGTAKNKNPRALYKGEKLSKYWEVFTVNQFATMFGYSHNATYHILTKLEKAKKIVKIYPATYKVVKT